ncbi:MAG: LacI family DNA-binding transcriptional regulator [Candidatus Omnitrophica bacterium]|jgi:LacI family transcriptional regulator|nr:MAG: Catabolite control protein A [Candidatus Hinthialibacteria bacterium OLB16]MBV6481376.1 Catabolite control protein A [bacterium]MCC6733410.1 LacI family DNA-binding transcriptional regulator [Candidatus Omnitrophota bacterium]
MTRNNGIVTTKTLKEPLNIRRIAEEAGVSVSTVSRFLSGSPKVKDKTRTRIHRVVEKYDFRPNMLAQSLARGQSNIIGVLAMEIANPCTHQVIQGIVSGCLDTKYTALTAFIEPQVPIEKSALNMLVSIKPSGIIVLSEPEAESPEFVEQLANLSETRNIPVVLAGDREGNTRLDCVTYDSRLVGYTATRHLIENGFEPVGCITGSLRSLNGRLRYEGYREALVDANITYNQELVYEGHFRKIDGYQGLHHFHRIGKIPRSIFCCNDYTAIGVYLAAEEIGLRIPEDFAVIGCDNIDLTTLVRPKLSSLNFDNAKNGESLVELLLKRIESPDSDICKILLKPSVIQRDSTMQTR